LAFFFTSNPTTFAWDTSVVVGEPTFSSYLGYLDLDSFYLK